MNFILLCDSNMLGVNGCAFGSGLIRHQGINGFDWLLLRKNGFYWLLWRNGSRVEKVLI